MLNCVKEHELVTFPLSIVKQTEIYKLKQPGMHVPHFLLKMPKSASINLELKCANAYNQILFHKVTCMYKYRVFLHWLSS